MLILLLSIDDFLYVVKSLQFRSGLPGGPLGLCKVKRSNYDTGLEYWVVRVHTSSAVL
jgi:hypothetical protein